MGEGGGGGSAAQGCRDLEPSSNRLEKGGSVPAQLGVKALGKMPPRASSSLGTQLRAFSVRGAAQWSHPSEASNQLPGSGESEPVAARLASLEPYILELAGFGRRDCPQPRKSHPHRERLQLAGAARAPGAGRRAGEGCRRKRDPASSSVASTWLPEGNSRSDFLYPAPSPRDWVNNH